MGGELREHLAPERGEVVVGDRDLDQARVDHLEDVLGLEVLGCRTDPHHRLAAAREVRVERLEALVEARRFTDEDFGAGQIVHGADGRRPGPGDHDLRDVLHRRVGEVHQLRALLCDREVAHGDVATPVPQRRHELVLGHWNDRDVHPDVAGLESPVEVALEHLSDLEDQPALDAAIDEVEGLRERGQDADQAALDHAVEIAGELRIEAGQREGALGRRRLGGSLGVCSGGGEAKGRQRREDRDASHGGPPHPE